MKLRPLWTRRGWIRAGLTLAAGRSFIGERLVALQQRPRTRPIPSTGERLPVVGLGSARTFSAQWNSVQSSALREVLRLFHESGGRVFDTAPTYGGAERLSGRLAKELEIENELFLATKVSTGGGREAGSAQMRGSMEAWGRTVVDLQQVHNLRGVDVHLETLREAKANGRVRYVGVTTSRLPQHGETEAILTREGMDFVQLNYSLGERQAADRLLPLAEDRGLAVLVNEPFNGGRLFGAIRGRSLPDWTADFDCQSWAQFFLKYILGHTGVTAVIPATGDPEHLVDNMGAALGALPDERQRRRMEAFLDGL